MRTHQEGIVESKKKKRRVKYRYIDSEGKKRGMAARIEREEWTHKYRKPAKRNHKSVKGGNRQEITKNGALQRGLLKADIGTEKWKEPGTTARRDNEEVNEKWE